MKQMMRLLSAMALVAQSAGAFAQVATTTFSLEDEVREGVMTADGSSAFFVTRGKGEVCKFRLMDGEVLVSGAAGPSPAALAIDADGSVLACVNRGADSLTLLRADDLGHLATIPCGKGAMDVAALPGGGFAVVNTFGDSVTLVDARAPHATTTLQAPGVPNSVAATTGCLAVGTRAPAAVLLFRASDRTPTAVRLASTPTMLAALPDGRFAVLTKSGVALVDTQAGALLAQREIEAQAIAVHGSDVIVLTGDGVQRLDSRLDIVETTSLPEASTMLLSGGPVVAAISTQARRVYIFNTGTVEAAPSGDLVVAAGVPTPETDGQAPSEAEPLSAPAAVETESSPIPSAEETPQVVAQDALAEEPAVAAAADASETGAREPSVLVADVVDRGKPIVEAENESTEADETQAKAPRHKPVFQASAKKNASESPEKDDANGQEITPTRSSFDSMPLGAAETRAPRSSHYKPSAIPLPQFEKPRFGEGLIAGEGLGSSQGGFVAPTLDVLRNVSADGEFSAVQDPETQQLLEVKASDNVRLSLDNMDFVADYFYYSAVTGQIQAEGHVEVTQGMAKLNAEQIHYTLPTPEQLEAVNPLILAEEDVEGRRLSLGKVEALDLALHEPARELSAKRVEYDFATRTGLIEDFRGRSGIYYYGGKQVRILGPASADGEDIWVTTCNQDPPHYRVRIKRATISENDVVIGKYARLQLGSADTPVFWPRWAMNPSQDRDLRFDFDSGHSADIGYYVNLGQRFAVNRDLDLGVRLLPTTREGVGFGLEAYYDYLETPASPLYRAKGEIRTLYTTEDRGYIEMYHRQDIFDEAVLRVQVEQWSDREFYKDFFYEAYRDRSAPRTFANLTYAQPEYIATATVRPRTNGFTAETERLPEVTYHLLERRIAEDLYFTFDTINGYNEREPSGTHAVRSINVARLTYDLGLTETWNLTPFVEGEGSWYSDGPDDQGADTRFSALAGLTLQTRFHRSFPGALGFSGFKHIVVPSVTFSYRPESSMSVEATPQFDAYDNVYGRSRIESKIDNIVFGRDARTKEVWQVARLTMYQGTDFWNERRKSDDYELELDLRPRPWWGWQLAGEHHAILNDFDLDEPFLIQRLLLEGYERIVGEPLNPESNFRYNAQYGDYDRLLTYLYYDDRNLGGRLNGRVGFAYTDTLGKVFNREVLYGMGYRVGEKWGVAFEHRYDFERGELTRQEYEISRDLHCWEASVQVRERESGWDFGVELSIKAFPGTGVKF